MPSCAFTIASVLAMLSQQMLVAPDQRRIDDEGTYPIIEHGVGKWFAFDAPVPVRHSLATRGLVGYQFTVRVHILVEAGQQKEIRFSFRHVWKFAPVHRAEPPARSHVELMIDEKHAVVLSPTATYGANLGGETLIGEEFVRIPAHIFSKMLAAKFIQGQFYRRTENDGVVEHHELRIFQFDPKFIRSLKALDSKAR